MPDGFKISFIVILLNLIFSNDISGQQQLFEQIYNPPVYSDLHQIIPLNQDSLLVAGKTLLLYDGKNWKAFKKQPPCHIQKLFVVNTDCIFVTNATKYQNSDLWLWNGKHWQKLYHPVANTINDLYFTDAQNGYLVSYGEIVRLKNGIWQHLNPPDNHNIAEIVNFRNQIYVLVNQKGIYKAETGHWHLIEPASNLKKILVKNGQFFLIGTDYLAQLIDDKITKISTDSLWKSVNDIYPADNQIIAVGQKGLIFQLKNQKIHQQKNQIHQNLNQIIAHATGLWVVGDGGIILKLQTHKPAQKHPKWKGFNPIRFNSKAKVIDDEYGVIAADFNNDGFTDIFTAGLFEADRLYINQGQLNFTNKAQAFGLTAIEKNHPGQLDLGACAGDLDNDGYIDLYVTVLNGKNLILKNINGKYFVNYSNIAGATGNADERTNACIMGDIDNDGDLDIFITNEFSTNRLYRNNGAGIFKEITGISGVQSKAGGNAASFADFDLDGDIDLFVTNWSFGNKLYQNMWQETGKLFFKDISRQAHITGEPYEKSNAVVFTDLNNDGYPDLYIANRKTSNRLYINNKDRTFSDQTAQMIGHDSLSTYGVVITDFDGDGLKDIYLSNVGKNTFYKQINGKFINQTQKYQVDINGYSTGSALADFDNDGDLDIYVANYVGDGSTLLINNADDNRFYKLKLNLSHSNRMGIGTKITVSDSLKNIIYTTELSAGSGYVSMNAPQLTFSVKNFPGYLKITLPDGQIIHRKITANSPKILQIADTGKFGQLTTRYGQILKNQIINPHKLWSDIKLIVLLLILFFSSKRGIQKLHWSVQKTFIYVFIILTFYGIIFQYFEFNNIILSTILPFSLVILLIFTQHYFDERRLLKTEAQLKQKNLKLKISRDLHDNLAATLSSIGLYNAMASEQLNQDRNLSQKLIEKSSKLVHEATATITDIIWSIQPKSQSLESLMLRLQQQFKPLLTAKKINFDIIWEKDRLKKQKVQDNFKQNTYLILKEALNNAVKYAQSTQISIFISQQKQRIIFKITDNGNGFDLSEKAYAGHGLQNMRNRALELSGGNFEIITNNQGTSIEFSFETK